MFIETIEKCNVMHTGILKILRTHHDTDKEITDFLTDHKEKIVEYLKSGLHGKKVAVVIYALKELNLIEINNRREVYRMI